MARARMIPMAVSHNPSPGTGVFLLLAASIAVAGLAGMGSCAARRARPADRVAVAEAATRAEDWPRAADLWNRVHLESGGTDPRAYRETARALFRSGDPDGACAMLDQGLRVFPDRPDLLELHGQILEACGFRRAAELSFARLIEVEPDRVSALTALGRLRLRLGHEQAALGPLRRALELSGGQAQVHALLGDALRSLGQPLEALRCYRQADELGGVGLETLVDAAALCVLDAVRANTPDALELGLGWLERVVAERPQHTRAHFLGGVLCEKAGRVEEAILHYRRAIETDPGHLGALRNLAAVYARTGDRAGAAEMVTRALEIESDPVRRSALIELLGAGSDGSGG